jgi:transposase
LVIYNTIQKDILEGKTNKKGTRGRPRARWIDNIKEWNKLPTEKLLRATEDSTGGT